MLECSWIGSLPKRSRGVRRGVSCAHRRSSRLRAHLMTAIRHDIRVVVFDVGETLVDETRAWSDVARAAGLTRLTLFAALGALIERGEDHRRVWKLLGVPPPSGASSVTLEDLYPDAVPCLQELRALGLGIGLAGNQPRDAAAALWRLGLPVDFIATSGEWGVEKPSARFFELVCETAGYPAHQIAYVGDRLDNDVLPACAAGMFSVFLRRGPWGALHAARPEAAQADARLDSLGQLAGVLPGRGGEPHVCVPGSPGTERI
jgi:FMN phosphatase YigB (HAD superfamily)